MSTQLVHWRPEPRRPPTKRRTGSACTRRAAAPGAMTGLARIRTTRTPSASAFRASASQAITRWLRKVSAGSVDSSAGVSSRPSYEVRAGCVQETPRAGAPVAAPRWPRTSARVDPDSAVHELGPSPRRPRPAADRRSREVDDRARIAQFRAPVPGDRRIPRRPLERPTRAPMPGPDPSSGRPVRGLRPGVPG